MRTDLSESGTMVGACGVVGDGSIDGMVEHLVWTGDEQVTSGGDDRLRIAVARHPTRDGTLPARVPGQDASVWVWGTVVGDEDGPRPSGESAAAFCARQYAADGVSFVERLNGDFAGVIHDRDRDRVRLFTDPLGSRRLFVTSTDNGILFTTQIQALADAPETRPAFHEGYAIHHLSWRGGPYGVKTPLQGVESVPPGTVASYAPDGSVTHDRYWRPAFPRDGGPSYRTFVDRFTERFAASVADRTRDRSKRYGILLSGGADARLVVAALPDELDVVAYHMADWMSKEARIAERVAMAADVPFRFLRRPPDYFDRVLASAPRLWNFEQLFSQAWAEGFLDEIRSEVDVLLTGHFLDTLFGGQFVPTRTADLGPFGRYDLPFEQPLETLPAYGRALGPRTPPFVESDVDLPSVVERSITRDDEGIEAYGVRFDSLRSFVLGRLHAPATTDPFFRNALRQRVELRTPAYDTRLLALWRQMPIRYKLRRSVVSDALAALDPELAAIPHAHSGIAAGAHPSIHRLGALPMNALRRVSPFEAIPADRVDHNPWGNHAALIRERSFVEDAIHDNDRVIRALPFLDWDAVRDCYRAHLDGTDNTKLLYRLVTFLEAPITQAIAGRRAAPDPAED